MTIQAAMRHAALTAASNLDRDGFAHTLRVVARLDLEQLPSALRETAVVVALLHDVVEDTPITLEQLKGLGYDPIVVHSVDMLTRRDEWASHEEYLGRYMARVTSDRVASVVKLADLEDNTSTERPMSDDLAERLGPRYREAKRMVKAAWPA